MAVVLPSLWWWTVTDRLDLPKSWIALVVATLGIVIGEKEYWGKGYGTEAVKTMLRYAFHELGLNRVELETYSFNPRAQRCYERAGFRREGVRRGALYRDGKFHDIIIMGILREEFLEGEDD